MSRNARRRRSIRGLRRRDPEVRAVGGEGRADGEEAGAAPGHGIGRLVGVLDPPADEGRDQALPDVVEGVGVERVGGSGGAQQVGGAARGEPVDRGTVRRGPPGTLAVRGSEVS